MEIDDEETKKDLQKISNMLIFEYGQYSVQACFIHLSSAILPVVASCSTSSASYTTLSCISVCVLLSLLTHSHTPLESAEIKLVLSSLSARSRRYLQAIKRSEASITRFKYSSLFHNV
ncbi:hypothetical protein CVS40_6917 [Lucilia cuprina]|nr:hypothetical protein CVS40_6917 [Lucilia cuprina]